MRWRIYYGDGSTYSDRDGSPYDAPPADVQVVAIEENNPKGFGLMHRKDAYFWRPDIGWNGCDLAGLWDYFLNHRGPKQVIFGRVIPTPDYLAMVGRAGIEGLG